MPNNPGSGNTLDSKQRKTEGNEMLEVYFNSHKGLFSIRHRGRVVRHARSLCLRDARFKVSEAGRQRVLRDKRKNVHAFICGEEIAEVSAGSGKQVTYNPFKYSSFVTVLDGDRVDAAKEVSLGIVGGKPYIVAY